MTNHKIKKYKCEKCKYNSTNKQSYERHLKCIQHCELHNICKDCLKEFKYPYLLKKHLNRRTPCNQQINIPINNETNNEELLEMKSEIEFLKEELVKLTQRTNNTITNSHNTTNSNNINNTYNLNIYDGSLKGIEYTYGSKLLSNAVEDLWNPNAINIFHENLQQNLYKPLEHLNILDNFIYEKLPISELIKKYKPIRTALTYLNNLGLHLYPNFQVCSGNEYILKLWLKCDEFSEEEYDIINDNSSEWIKMNNKSITNFINTKVLDAINDTYLNIYRRKHLCMYPHNGNIYHKDNQLPTNTLLSKFTKETIIKLIDDNDKLSSLVFRHLTDFQISYRKIDVDFLKINDDLVDKISELFDNKDLYNHRLKQLV